MKYFRLSQFDCRDNNYSPEQVFNFVHLEVAMMIFVFMLNTMAFKAKCSLSFVTRWSKYCRIP